MTSLAGNRNGSLMNHPDINASKIIKRLEDIRAALIEENFDTATQPPKIMLEGPHLGPLLSNARGFKIADIAPHNKQNVLRAIDELLHQFDQGCFGQCTECQEWIPLRQLEQDPTQRRCLDCALA